MRRRRIGSIEQREMRIGWRVALLKMLNKAKAKGDSKSIARWTRDLEREDTKCRVMMANSKKGQS